MSIEFSIKAGIASLVLSRIQKKNAISHEMWQSITLRIRSIDTSEAKVLVIRSSSDFFSAGADLEEIKSLKTIEDANGYWNSIKVCLDSIANLAIPTLTVIDGYCLGGGLLLALASDFRYASLRSSFAIPIAKLGIILDLATVARLTFILGPRVANEMLLLGDTICSAEALKVGLVNAIFEPDELNARVEHITSTLISQNESSLAHTKHQLKEIERQFLLALERESSTLVSQERKLIAESYLNMGKASGFPA